MPKPETKTEQKTNNDSQGSTTNRVVIGYNLFGVPIYGAAPKQEEATLGAAKLAGNPAAHHHDDGKIHQCCDASAAMREGRAAQDAADAAKRTTPTNS